MSKSKIANKKTSAARQPALHKANVSRSFLADVRQAVADYIATEGCSCCQDVDGHKAAMERLGKLIRMKKYSDGSGYDYGLYRSKE